METPIRQGFKRIVDDNPDYQTEVIKAALHKCVENVIDAGSSMSSAMYPYVFTFSGIVHTIYNLSCPVVLHETHVYRKNNKLVIVVVVTYPSLQVSVNDAFYDLLMIKLESVVLGATHKISQK